MVDRSDGDVDEFSPVTVECQRHEFGARSAQLAVKLLGSDRHDAVRSFRRQFHHGVTKGPRDADRSITGWEAVARGGADDRDPARWHERVSESMVAESPEVGTDRSDSSRESVTARRRDGHGSMTLGKVEEHTGQRRFLRCLPLEPALPSTSVHRFVDSAVGNPRWEGCHRVAGADLHRLSGWAGVQLHVCGRYRLRLMDRPRSAALSSTGSVRIRFGADDD